MKAALTETERVAAILTIVLRWQRCEMVAPKYLVRVRAGETCFKTFRSRSSMFRKKSQAAKTVVFLSRQDIVDNN